MNLTCPTCGEKLKAQKLGRGMAWGCEKCEGKAVNLTIIKNISDPSSIQQFWMAVKGSAQTDDRKCPACRKSMRVHHADELGGIEVDACVTCQFLWFDHTELEKVPRASRQEIEERERELRKMVPTPRTEDPTFIGLGIPSTRKSFLGSIFELFFWI